MFFSHVLIHWSAPWIAEKFPCWGPCWLSGVFGPGIWLAGGTTTSRSEALLRNPGWLAWILIWGFLVIWAPGVIAGISWNIVAMYTNYKCYRVGEREMWSQCTTIEISSLLLWPVDPLLSDALLYFYDNKHILNKLVALFQTSMAGPCLRFPTTCLAEICGACWVVKQSWNAFKAMLDLTLLERIDSVTLAASRMKGLLELVTNWFSPPWK